MPRPLISIVTPSYNQVAFIERNIESVLAQRGEFELEHIVVDGGSTDGSVELLRRYGDRLRLVSEPDRGQCDAVNKGFRMARGEMLGWLNSDDTYEAGAVQAAVRAMTTGARWVIGDCRIVDEADREIRSVISAYKRRGLRRYGRTRLIAGNFISQPAVFFRRDLLDAAGPLDESLEYAMDYDLWLRFAALAEPACLPETLASFRWHGGSKTGGRYGTGAWECFGIARRRARGLERLALGVHLAQYVAQIAVYRALDRFGAGAVNRG